MRITSGNGLLSFSVFINFFTVSATKLLIWTQLVKYFHDFRNDCISSCLILKTERANLENVFIN